MPEEIIIPPVEPIAPPATPPAPQGRVFTEEYVQSLREEAKNHRIAKKGFESKLKSVLGLKDDEEISDDKITAFQANNAKAIADSLLKANDRLISAEIKSLEGYDAKLVDRLLDKSKLKIDDQGNVTGLKEAVAALEAEFPQIKVVTVNPPAPGANPPPKPGAKTAQEEYDDLLKQAQKDPSNSALRQKLFIAKEKLK